MSRLQFSTKADDLIGAITSAEKQDVIKCIRLCRDALDNLTLSGSERQDISLALARCYLKIGEYHAVIETLKPIFARSRSIDEAYKLMIIAQSNLGREVAVRYYYYDCIQYTGDSYTDELLQYVYDADADAHSREKLRLVTDEEKKERIINKAALHCLENEYERAIELLRGVIARYGMDEQAGEKLAYIYCVIRDYRLAEYWADRTLKKFPESFIAILSGLMAGAYSEKGAWTAKYERYARGYKCEDAYILQNFGLGLVGISQYAVLIEMLDNNKNLAGSSVWLSLRIKALIALNRQEEAKSYAKTMRALYGELFNASYIIEYIDRGATEIETAVGIDDIPAPIIKKYVTNLALITEDGGGITELNEEIKKEIDIAIKTGELNLLDKFLFNKCGNDIINENLNFFKPYLLMEDVVRDNVRALIMTRLAIARSGRLYKYSFRGYIFTAKPFFNGKRMLEDETLHKAFVYAYGICCAYRDHETLPLRDVATKMSALYDSYSEFSDYRALAAVIAIAANAFFGDGMTKLLANYFGCEESVIKDYARDINKDNRLYGGEDEKDNGYGALAEMFEKLGNMLFQEDED